MVGLHLVSFVVAIRARIDSCGSAFAFSVCVYCEREAVEVGALTDSSRRREFAW